MDSLERCRILCGISEDNTKKLGLLTVLLEKAREDIEAFCRDTFIEALTNDAGIITGYTDVFPKQLIDYVLSWIYDRICCFNAGNQYDRTCCEFWKRE